MHSRRLRANWADQLSRVPGRARMMNLGLIRRRGGRPDADSSIRATSTWLTTICHEPVRRPGTSSASQHRRAGAVLPRQPKRLTSRRMASRPGLRARTTTTSACSTTFIRAATDARGASTTRRYVMLARAVPDAIPHEVGQAGLPTCSGAGWASRRRTAQIGETHHERLATNPGPAADRPGRQ